MSRQLGRCLDQGTEIAEGEWRATFRAPARRHVSCGRSVDMHAVLTVVTGDHEAIRRCVMSDDSVLAAG
jgi:microcystin degradation protein MlrC